MKNLDDIKAEERDVAWILYQKDIQIVLLQKKLAVAMELNAELVERLESKNESVNAA